MINCRDGMIPASRHWQQPCAWPSESPRRKVCVMGVSLSRLIADLLGASVGIWGIWNLLQKQHKLRGAARALRWVVVIAGIAVFEASEHGWLNRHWGLEFCGIMAAGFFFLFPDISYYLVMGWQKWNMGRSRTTQFGDRQK